MNCIEDFQAEVHAAGYVLADPPVPDGKLHRFAHQDRNGAKSGWYILHGDGIPAGTFGDWRSGKLSTWCAKRQTDLDPQEAAQHRQRIEEQKRTREAEEKRTRDQAAECARQQWDASKPASANHPYLVRKKVQPHGIRQSSDGRLIIPLRNSDDAITSLQNIYGAGNKRFLPGGQKKGCYYLIEGAGPTIYFGEGFATAATISEATGATVAVAFDAGNLLPVAQAIHAKNPKARLVFCADNDQWTDGNPGLTKAAEATAAVKGGEMIHPQFKDLSSKPTDFNDLATLEGVEEVKRQLFATKPAAEDIFSKPAKIGSFLTEQPPEIIFLAKDRIPQGRGILITGLGGSSKTRLLYHLGIGANIGRLSWSWEIQRTGKAVLFLTEDIEEDAHRTIYYMANGLNPTEKRAVTENLIIYPLAGKDFRLLIRTAAGTVEKSPLFYALVKKIVEIGNVIFVGIDPALSVSEGDELDQGHQRALGKMADDLAIQTGATCALVSHATKASLSTKELNSHNSRGGGAITDAVRAEYSMRNMTVEEAAKAGIDDPEERKRHVQLVATKGNALPPSAFVPIWLRRDNSGSLLEAQVVFKSSGRGPGKKDMEALQVLQRLSEYTTTPLHDWRAECAKQGIIGGQTSEAKTKAMQRVIKNLKAADFITRGVGKGIWLPNHENDF